ncbi:hypothetical protein OMD46_04005 [Pseudomonas sp. MDMC_285]|nr:hypothetical protein [Pseudomonas sp. MDMC_285]
MTADALLVWSEFCRKQIEAFFQRDGQPADFAMPLAGYLASAARLRARSPGRQAADALPAATQRAGVVHPAGAVAGRVA